MEILVRHEPRPENLSPTSILDSNHPKILELAELFRKNDTDDRTRLQAIHRHLVKILQPVYSLNEWQPASTTLHKGRGSCSQRMACLEAVARASGMATRVRAFWVKGEFWAPRFRFARWFIPNRILLLWPQFFLDAAWIDFDELYGSIEDLAAQAGHGFVNNAESLFEAVERTPIDFRGRTCGLACGKPEHDLSKFVAGEEGIFDTRDEALGRFVSLQFSIRGRWFEFWYGDRTIL